MTTDPKQRWLARRRRLIKAMRRDVRKMLRIIKGNSMTETQQEKKTSWLNVIAITALAFLCFMFAGITVYFEANMQRLIEQYREEQKAISMTWTGPGEVWRQHGTAWECGTDFDGCVAYPVPGGWLVNVMRMEHVWSIGPFKSAKAARKAAEVKWAELVVLYGE